MQELLEQWIPNVMDKLPEFGQAITDTIVMTLWSGVIAFIAGMILGIVMTVTKNGGILENRAVFQILDKLINIFRSVPFIILLTALLPLTRFVTGTAIGVKGAILPLVFGVVPFFTRQVESALAEVDTGLIEAAESIGYSPLEIIYRVYLREGIPALARVTTITLINLIGLTAMAGVVGAGGLGDFAIRYGHNRFQTDVTAVTVVVLILMVCIIQMAGSMIAKKNTH